MDNIKEALPGACFHGGVWMSCPHCGEAFESYSAHAEYVKGKFGYYKCTKCGNMFKDRITY